MGEQLVEIFWTGGFDSSFRIVQLSRMPVVIQAYYLGDNRESEPNEINAMNRIMDVLKVRPETKCTFLPLVIYKKAQQKDFVGPEVTQAYKDILKNGYFGSQYDWLGRFAKGHAGIEMSIHKGGNAVNMIIDNGKMLEIEVPVIGKTFVADSSTTDPNVYMLFKDCSFPLAEWSKTEMREEYIRLGYKDVMDLTWFCYHPMDDGPCGLCSPCRQTIEEGLDARFPPKALKRRKHRKFLFPFYRVKWKIESMFRKV